MAAMMTSRNKALSCFSSPRWCIAPVPSTSTWRWCPVSPYLVQEFGYVVVLTFLSFMVAVDGVGFVVSRRVDRARFPIPYGVCWRRASIHDRRSSGCIPGRCVFSDGFFICGSNQSICVGCFWLVFGGVRRWRWRARLVWSSTEFRA
jgi:hypothetical protein